ncbi:MAG TPA: ATP-binding cassette domain-containing protein [candidate division WWE3 bacterium]|uniref:ATP-binding cassette domain-containing protein n=1 Tax=candidate division WWE3 bacterium TaxID=2053526 RepID=A0A7V5J0S8_UNCKA|nr:ATP-binding cassette domain-containing protein [candidate division WWE3 bacterium]
MLVLQGVSKKFGDKVILEDVDLHIKPGEFVYLTGPSGAGKSTLLSLILREQLPDSGTIMVDSEDISKIKDKDVYKLRRKIGFVFQDYRLLPTKNSFENISIALEIIGKTKKQIKERVEELLSLVGLEDRIYNFPWQLSGGEKQRLAIARAMALEPKIIVADEPTGNLDAANSWEILNLLVKLNKDMETTTLLATHDLNLVKNLKKRTIHLEGGRITSHD